MPGVGRIEQRRQRGVAGRIGQRQTGEGVFRGGPDPDPVADAVGRVAGFGARGGVERRRVGGREARRRIERPRGGGVRSAPKHGIRRRRQIRRRRARRAGPPQQVLDAALHVQRAVPIFGVEQLAAHPDHRLEIVGQVEGLGLGRRAQAGIVHVHGVAQPHQRVFVIGPHGFPSRRDPGVRNLEQVGHRVAPLANMLRRPEHHIRDLAFDIDARHEFIHRKIVARHRFVGGLHQLIAMFFEGCFRGIDIEFGRERHMFEPGQPVRFGDRVLDHARRHGIVIRQRLAHLFGARDVAGLFRLVHGVAEPLPQQHRLLHQVFFARPVPGAQRRDVRRRGAHFLEIGRGQLRHHVVQSPLRAQRQLVRGLVQSRLVRAGHVRPMLVIHVGLFPAPDQLGEFLVETVARRGGAFRRGRRLLACRIHRRAENLAHVRLVRVARRVGVEQVKLALDGLGRVEISEHDGFVAPPKQLHTGAGGFVRR